MDEETKSLEGKEIVVQVNLTGRNMDEPYIAYLTLKSTLLVTSDYIFY